MERGGESHGWRDGFRAAGWCLSGGRTETDGEPQNYELLEFRRSEEDRRLDSKPAASKREKNTHAFVLKGYVRSDGLKLC